ncbi:3421_t:CDS:2, partial [Dentiscutata heterogama]
MEETIDIEFYVNYSEFISKHEQRRYCWVQFNISDLYFNSKLELQIDKEKGKKYLMLAAKNGDKDAITLCEKNKINFINKQNYFEKFKIARNLHKSRNINNGQE